MSCLSMGRVDPSRAAISTGSSSTLLAGLPAPLGPVEYVDSRLLALQGLTEPKDLHRVLHHSPHSYITAHPPMTTDSSDQSVYDLARDRAATLSTRLKERQVQLRSAFVHSPPTGADPPMATRLHQARCKGGLDLRLELTLLWAAGGTGVDPASDLEHAVRFEAVDYAELLAIEQPESKGKRQVSASLKRLETRGLIERMTQPGRPTLILIKREIGDGAPYSRPGDPQHPEGSAPYLKLPATLWTRGWINALSPSALLSLLAILHLNELADRAGSPLFLSPSRRKASYGFSEDTWYAGVNELAGCEIVTKTRQKVRQPFNPDHPRYRDALYLDTSRLQQDPALPADPLALLLEAERTAGTDARAALGRRK